MEIWRPLALVLTLSVDDVMTNGPFTVSVELGNLRVFMKKEREVLEVIVTSGIT